VDGLYAIWGANLKEARRSTGLSQVELAAACDVTQQTVSGWEQGVYAPRDGMKLRLSGILNRPVADLFPFPDGNGLPLPGKKSA
jgi:transcriptional regulator with XRE-family HTH domain